MNELELQQRLAVTEETIRVLQNELAETNRGLINIAIEEEQRRQLQKMEAVRRFAGGVCHDFNNLLTVIIGYSHILLDSLDRLAPASQSVEEIRKAAVRAEALTRRLMILTHRMPHQSQELDLNTLVTEFRPAILRLLGDNIPLMMVLTPSPCKVFVDPVQFEQVIMNLVSNAKDAMPHGGTLTFETAVVELKEALAKALLGIEAGPYVQLSVRDTGIGMNEESKAHLFEPFFTTKQREQGSGLGLATVYGIVKQSSGAVFVSSEPGCTKVTIYLPRHTAPCQTPEPISASAAAASARGTETILVVEDETGVRSFCREVLKGQGYTVLEASSGPAALKLANEYTGPIHLLLSDVVMPEMNGRVLAERLAAERPAMKVAYMSGYTDYAFLGTGVLENARNLLQKPFAPLALTRKVRDVLDGKT